MCFKRTWVHYEAHLKHWEILILWANTVRWMLMLKSVLTENKIQGFVRKLWCIYYLSVGQYQGWFYSHDWLLKVWKTMFRDSRKESSLSFLLSILLTHHRLMRRCDLLICILILFSSHCLWKCANKIMKNMVKQRRKKISLYLKQLFGCQLLSNKYIFNEIKQFSRIYRLLTIVLNTVW